MWGMAKPERKRERSRKMSSSPLLLDQDDAPLPSDTLTVRLDRHLQRVIPRLELRQAKSAPHCGDRTSCAVSRFEAHQVLRAGVVCELLDDGLIWRVRRESAHLVIDLGHCIRLP